MTNKNSKRITKKTHKKSNFGRGISSSKSRAMRSKVTPILDLPLFGKKRANSDSFEKSKVTPILSENYSIPLESPYKTLSPEMFRLVYEGDLPHSYSDDYKILDYDEDGNVIVNFDLPLYDSIDKPGRFAETIYQRPTKYKTPYDVEAPNPFWSNSNDDFGQFVELSKSASPNLGRGTKRKYNSNKKLKKKSIKKSIKKSLKKKN
jgi:hypothetical protein